MYAYILHCIFSMPNSHPYELAVTQLHTYSTGGTYLGTSLNGIRTYLSPPKLNISTFLRPTPYLPIKRNEQPHMNVYPAPKLHHLASKQVMLQTAQNPHHPSSVTSLRPPPTLIILASIFTTQSTSLLFRYPEAFRHQRTKCDARRPSRENKIGVPQHIHGVLSRSRSGMF
jgi:hypothetical protein